jgi:HSP20 family protein
MANLIRRDDGNRQLSSQRSGSALDPFRLMRDMMRWDPFRDLEGGVPFEPGFIPTFDVAETNDAYLFRADMPGVKEEDLEVSLTGNRLTVSGKREREQVDESSQYYASERSYGMFSRSFTLPEGIDSDQVKAELKNGVLALTIPKRPEVQPRKISLGGKSSSATPSGNAPKVKS